MTEGLSSNSQLSLEGPGHDQPHLQELRPQRRRRRLPQFVRYGHHGQRPHPPLSRPAQETSSRATDTSAATRIHGRRRIRSTTVVPVVRSLALHGCNAKEEDRRLLDLRPHLLGVAAQGAELLLRQVPGAPSPLGSQEAQEFSLGQNAR